MSFWETFVKLFPEIIKAAATSPLGVVSLIVLCLSLIIMVLFSKQGNAGITLAAFFGLLASLSFFGWLLFTTTGDVRDKILVIGPGALSLDGPKEWRSEAIVVAPGTSVKTNGFPLKIEATSGSIEVNDLSILSYNENEAPKQLSEIASAKPGAAQGEADRCKAGLPGNRGNDGDTGAPGENGKSASPVTIIAARSIVGRMTVRNTGMQGGDGGPGGLAGRGGQGQQSGQGEMNHFLGEPTDCRCGGGWGGAPGRGGDGKEGGTPGNGGKGGDLIVQAIDATGLVIEANVEGGLQGMPGKPGSGGLPGLPGDGGRGEGPRCDDETNNRRSREPGQAGLTLPAPFFEPKRAPDGTITAPGANVTRL